jgi:hypothetical protein
MHEANELSPVYARAEPDDEYDREREKFDPYLIDGDDESFLTEEDEEEEE